MYTAIAAARPVGVVAPTCNIRQNRVVCVPRRIVRLAVQKDDNPVENAIRDATGSAKEGGDQIREGADKGGNAAEKGVDAVTDAGSAVADKAREAVDTIKDKIDNASKWPETDAGKGSSS